MTGRPEVLRNRQKLDATFGCRIRLLPAEAEIQSDFAKYLCILVSGFLETSVTELILERTRKRASPTIQRFVESKVRRGTNLKSDRLKDLLGSFDPDWQASTERLLVDEKKDALDSVVSLRNGIAHGRPVGLTVQSITNYYRDIVTVIDAVADLCDPIP